MDNFTIALFGEAEKGEYRTPYFCQTLPQLVECLGNPPPDSLGLFIAVQALLYNRNLLFIRVKEEGYNHQDYVLGLHFLETQNVIKQITALFLPGVGDGEILHAMTPFCKAHNSILVTREADLYDYLTSVNFYHKEAA